MKKIIFLAILALTGTASLHAQSLTNTNWKTYIADPLYDTLTLHIRIDSSFVTVKSGDTVVRSLCKVSGDTIALNDYAGQYACQGTIGKYKFSITDEVMTLILIDDLCDGRAQSIVSVKWKKTK